jgi:Flp pilus assembly protein TadD
MTTARTLALVVALGALAGCGGAPSSPQDPSSSSATNSDAAKPTPDGSAKPDASGDLTDAETAIKAQDFAKAKAAAESALAKDPKNAKAMYYAGLAAEGLGDATAAEQKYRDALKQAPDLADAAVNLSALLLDQKRGADAVTVLKPLAEKQGDDPLIQANYASALAQSGDHGGAAAIYAKLVAKPDAKPEVRLGYAAELSAAGKKDDAAKVLRDGLASAGDQRDVLAAYGRALAQAGAYDDAVKAMDRAIAQKSSADLYTYRALFKRGQKNLDGARADLEAAVKEDPKFAHAYEYLGEVLEELKKPADAKKAYQKAIDLAGDAGPGKKAKAKLDAMKGKK